MDRKIDGILDVIDKDDIVEWIENNLSPDEILEIFDTPEGNLKDWMLDNYTKEELAEMLGFDCCYIIKKGARKDEENRKA
jgi:hypothetical protein